MSSPPTIAGPDATERTAKDPGVAPAASAADCAERNNATAALQTLWRELDRAAVHCCTLPARAAGRDGRARIFDLLVARTDAAAAEAAALLSGLCRLRPPGGAGAPGHAEFLVLDAADDGLVRLVLWYTLPLRRDEPFYGQLPWESALLGQRRHCAVCGTWHLDHAHTALLAVAWDRASLPRAAANGDYAPAARELLGAAVTAADATAAVQRRLRPHRCLGVARRVALHLTGWRSMRAGPDRRVPANGGLCIAFVGCDGAGKSTVTARFAAWLSPWLCIERSYLGSGDGSCSWLRWPLLRLHRLATRRRQPGQAAAPAGMPASNPIARGPRRVLRDLLRPLWALLLALEKRQKLRRVWRARAAGVVVICDRYPQNEIAGYNDGPLLTAWESSANPLRRALARWERRPYEWAHLHPPDLVVKLLVGSPVAAARKPDMSTTEIERRIAAVATLAFGRRTPVLSVDAEAPLDTVVRTVRRGVFARL